MTDTLYFTALTHDRQAVSPGPQALNLKPGGRLHRILRFIADGPKPTPAVYVAARKRWDSTAKRENPNTRHCLRQMQAAGWITLSNDRVSITDTGRDALEGAAEGRAA